MQCELKFRRICAQRNALSRKWAVVQLFPIIDDSSTLHASVRIVTDWEILAVMTTLLNDLSTRAYIPRPLVRAALLDLIVNHDSISLLKVEDFLGASRERKLYCNLASWSDNNPGGPIDPEVRS